MSDEKPYPIIDFHVHAFTAELAPTAVARLSVQCGFQACFDGTPAGLQGSMQRSGIDLALIQPVATKAGQVYNINRWSASLSALSGILSFGALHPDLPLDQVQAEVAFLKARGIPGVKLHSEYQAFYPDEDRLTGIYEALQSAGLILLMHAGQDLGFAGPIKATPERILQVHQGFPRLTLVAAHLGGYQHWAESEKHLAGKPLWLDTAYCLHDAPDPAMIELMRAHGSERILFGSDAPWGNQPRHVEILRQLDFSPREIADMAGKNAYNLLKLEHPKP